MIWTINDEPPSYASSRNYTEKLHDLLRLHNAFIMLNETPSNNSTQKLQKLLNVVERGPVTNAGHSGTVNDITKLIAVFAVQFNLPLLHFHAYVSIICKPANTECESWDCATANTGRDSFLCAIRRVRPKLVLQNTPKGNVSRYRRHTFGLYQLRASNRIKWRKQNIRTATTLVE